MVSIDNVAKIALGLPGVSEGTRYGNRTWFVAGKGFVWERPFSKADIKRFGTSPRPDGAILAVATEDLGEKEALLAARPELFFTIPHFDGYAALLLRLDGLTKKTLREVLVDAWLACAPTPVAEEFLASKRSASADQSRTSHLSHDRTLEARLGPTSPIYRRECAGRALRLRSDWYLSRPRSD